MSAAIGAGVVTGDFGSAWNMMNTLQILAFIPMMQHEIPIQLESALKSFLDFDIVPNLFEYVMDEDDFVGPSPYDEA